MNYSCLKNNKFEIGVYSVVPLREEDVMLIKEWRNSQMDVLRQKVMLSDTDQIRYYENYVKPSFIEANPRIILFSFLYDNKCIGYGGLTNIDWEFKRIELSFLIDTKRKNNDMLYKADFSAFINLMKIVVFKELNFNRIFTETYDIRPLHTSILEQEGFVLEGRLKEHVKIDNTYVDSLIHGYLNKMYNA